MALSNCTDKNSLVKVTTTVTNNSNHKVSFTGYSNGNTEYNSTINHSESFSKSEVYDGGGPNHFIILDSIIVVFDDSISVLHKNTILGQLPTSNRSLSNHNNYSIIKTDQEKQYQYIITQQDYLDAL
jgi:hypothetical protein